MIQTQNLVKPDILGASASGICLVHCAATPFLFMTKACSVAGCAHAPVWWQAIDYLFLGVSFLAIFYATRNSSKKWVRMALWASWVVLLGGILNETFEAGLFFESFVYIPAAAIVALHLYNQKYCHCRDETACTT